MKGYKSDVDVLFWVSQQERKATNGTKKPRPKAATADNYYNNEWYSNWLKAGRRMQSPLDTSTIVDT